MDSSAAAATTGGGYADSVDSSPRSRGGDSWDDPFPTAAARLRLMCSFGGRIVPRPTDKSLCYVGGETRMVVVDRQCSLSDLTAKLCRTFRSAGPFTLKYQLPNEDLDSLISVTTDEDLDNMIDEYDRLSAATGGGARSSRLRLFLFPDKTESAPPSSIGSLLDDSKSETWFEDALNSAMIGLPRGISADAASVNCLLGLEDDASVHSRGGAGVVVGGQAEAEHGGGGLARPESSGKLGRQAQDVQSVPDSPLLDNSSSFGSASSAPSLSSLPPIRVRPDERQLPDHRIDEHLAHMNLSAAAVGHQRSDEGFKEPQPPPASYAPQFQHPSHQIPLPTISDDDKLSDHGGGTGRNPPPPKSVPTETLILDPVSRTNYINSNFDLKRESPDHGYSVPIQASGGGYVLSSMQPEQLHQPQHMQPLPHLHQQQQQQYIQANAHYIHHPATGTVVPISSYFHPMAGHPIQQSHQAHHPYDPQLPMYYLPVRAPTQYNFAAAVPAGTLADPNSLQQAGKTGVPAPRVTAKPELQPANVYRTSAPMQAPQTVLQPQLIRVAASADQGHPFAGVGYHLMQQQQHLAQAPAQISNFGYEYTHDPAHAQVYYSQATSGAAQYQAVHSGAGAVTADVVAAGEVKAART